MLRLSVLSAFLLAGCDGAKDTKGEDSAVPDTTDDTGTGGGNGGGGDDTGGGGGDEDGTIPAMRVDGSVTWTLDFDAAAEGEGYTDCTYTRTFEGVQYLDMGYLCPDCDVQARGTAMMTEGVDCYAQISSTAAEEVERLELWGFSDAAFFRSGRDQFPLGELAPLSGVAEGQDVTLSWASDSSLKVGTMNLQASGSFRYAADEETLLADPWAPRTEPYACGWPQNDPGDLVLDYHLQAGQTFPNVRLVDQCGEELALWDLYGSWLILDTSQSDCGPCRAMAEGATAFVEDMAAEGYDVKVVSLLGNGLAEPFNTPPTSTFESWVSTFELTDPVLYDRGFAYALFPGFIEDFTGEAFGYPTWLVVDPEMNLVSGNVGFGSWDDVGDTIREADSER